MDRTKFINELTSLGRTFKYQLDSEYMSNIMTQCKIDAEHLKAIVEAAAEIKQLKDDNYLAMNKDYWDGVRLVFSTINKHLEALNEFTE